MLWSCEDQSGDLVKDLPNPLQDPVHGPPAGNQDGNSAIPSVAGLEDVTNPDQVVGTGNPQSCTCDAFVDAVAKGGKIVFDCGPDPVTIEMDRPAKVFNDANPEIVIDGGGLITLSGGGKTRILYMNTCDEDQHWTTSHCQNQDHPSLTVQNLTFVNGNSTSETEYDGGGATWIRGGRFKIVNCRFFNNVCASVGPDVGGGAVRVFSQYKDLPVRMLEIGVTCPFTSSIAHLEVLMDMAILDPTEGPLAALEFPGQLLTAFSRTIRPSEMVVILRKTIPQGEVVVERFTMMVTR